MGRATFAKRHFSGGPDGRGQGRRRREGSGGEEKLEDILEKSNWPSAVRISPPTCLRAMTIFGGPI